MSRSMQGHYFNKLHTKYSGDQSICSKRNFKGFNHIWIYEPDKFNKLCPLYPKEMTLH